ncbi:phosphopantetheine-binding protein [Enterobacter sp. Bisph1]|uniref:phosphopantetheine-binding protein n=1 Tax=Enterobacter sp. Bisph1 TaxID=1274399 RepID=UPI00057BE5E4|nr:phosphopantetheine-binding protein [Enterobacter sp. Bisph1]
MLREETLFDDIRNLINTMKDMGHTEITKESKFKEMEFDSLDYVELQIFMFETYSIKIPDNLFADNTLTSIQDLINFAISQQSL